MPQYRLYTGIIKLAIDFHNEDAGEAAAVFASPLAVGGFRPGYALVFADAEQLGVGIGDAFARLRAYAYLNDLRLRDVARDIVARRLRLPLDPGLSLGDEA
jgi:hypothetical protein